MDTLHTAPEAKHQPKPITIRIDNVEFHVPQHEMTGTQLKGLVGVSASYQLFLETPGSAPDRGIRDDEVVHLHQGEKFYAVPAGTLG